MTLIENNDLRHVAHFHHAHSQCCRQNVISEVLHIHRMNHSVSSTLSVRVIISLTSPSTTTSYPDLEQLTVKASSTFTAISSLLCISSTI
ncbi:unnamed protein product [Rotaria sp. Silwood2]|nr:unnamed protein product [Rotaria sp. Silwood2]CAF4296948.1 unnamed protein product [Rotaria sp. Silwood2]